MEVVGSDFSIPKILFSRSHKRETSSVSFPENENGFTAPRVPIMKREETEVGTSNRKLKFKLALVKP